MICGSEEAIAYIEGLAQDARAEAWIAEARQSQGLSQYMTECTMKEREGGEDENLCEVV